MNGKAVGGILVAALAVGGLAVVNMRKTEESVRASDGGEYLFPEIVAAEGRIAEIQLRGGTGGITLKLADGAWVAADRFNYPVDVSRIRPLTVSLSELRGIEKKTANPGLFDRIGVGEPAPDKSTVVVTLRDSTGLEIVTVHLGEAESGPAGTRQYVRRGGDNQSWLADRYTNTVTTFAEWADSSLVNVPRTRASRVSITHADGEQVLISRASEEDTFFMLENLPEGREVGNPGILNDLANALLSNRFEDVKPLASLDRSEERRVSTLRMETFDGMRVEAELFNDEAEKLWVVYSAEALDADAESPVEEIAALNAKAADWAFSLPSWQTDRMRRRMAFFLKPLADILPMDPPIDAPTEDEPLNIEMPEEDEVSPPPLDSEPAPESE